MCRKHTLEPEPGGALEGHLPGEGSPGLRQSDASRSAEQARIAELEQVLGRMTLENEILKKASSRLGLTPGQKRDMMLLLREQYPINNALRGAGRASQQRLLRTPAGRGPAASGRPDRGGRAVADVRLSSPDQAAQAARVTVVNAKRVRRLMHELGIAGEAPERKPRTTDSGHAYPRYPNLVEGLEVTRPDQVWVADITYIRLRKEFVYLISDNGCLHALHSGLAPGARAWTRS